MKGIKITETPRSDMITVESRNLVVQYISEDGVHVKDLSNGVGFCMSISEARRLAEAIEIIMDRK